MKLLFSELRPHPDDHTTQTTDTPGLNTFYYDTHKRCENFIVLVPWHSMKSKTFKNCIWSWKRLRTIQKFIFLSRTIRFITKKKSTSSPVVPASFNVTSPVMLVGRTRLGRLAINGKSKMAEPGEESNFSQLHFVSIIYNDPWMFGRDVCNLYIRNILWSSQKKEGFRRAISGTFSRWTGTFLPFCARPSRYRAQFQASSFHLDSGNWPGDEAENKYVGSCTFPCAWA